MKYPNIYLGCEIYQFTDISILQPIPRVEHVIDVNFKVLLFILTFIFSVNAIDITTAIVGVTERISRAHILQLSVA